MDKYEVIMCAVKLNPQKEITRILALTEPTYWEQRIMAWFAGIAYGNEGYVKCMLKAMENTEFNTTHELKGIRSRREIVEMIWKTTLSPWSDPHFLERLKGSDHIAVMGMLFLLDPENRFN